MDTPTATIRRRGRRARFGGLSPQEQASVYDRARAHAEANLQQRSGDGMQEGQRIAELNRNRDHINRNGGTPPAPNTLPSNTASALRGQVAGQRARLGGSDPVRRLPTPVGDGTGNRARGGPAPYPMPMRQANPRDGNQALGNRQLVKSIADQRRKRGGMRLSKLR
jgi:hypothetical protein